VGSLQYDQYFLKEGMDGIYNKKLLRGRGMPMDINFSGAKTYRKGEDTKNVWYNQC